MLQGISKSWRAVIAASPGLQERMFLRLQNATSKETWVLDGPNRSGLVGNIAAYRKSVELTGVPKLRLFDGDRTTGAEFLIPLTLNPIFNLIDTIHNLARLPFSTASRLTGSAKSPTFERVCLSGVDAVRICVPPVALRRQCSLWNVYLSDPPCRVATGKLNVKFQGSQPYRTSTFMTPKIGFRAESDAGLTFGDILTAASRSTEINCCEFEGGWVWKDMRTELKDMIDDTEQPSGWTSLYDVEHITIYIELPRVDGGRPAVVTDEDRAAVAAEEENQVTAED